MNRPGKDSDAQLLLRLPSALKAELQREAAIQGRTLTAEINLRLQASLKGAGTAYPASPPTVLTTAHGAPSGLETKEKSPADPLSETDRAMLGVFRRMPVEKQLALLSLFK